MSKIGIYSDVHISRTSSILPLYLNDNDKYSYRLKYCIDSLNEAYNYFKKEKVDVIINCGDTFNANILSSDEQDAFVNILSNNINVYEDNYLPFLHIMLVGNHDKYNDTFNSCSLVNLLNNTYLVNDYIYFDIDDLDCYCISYYNYEDFYNNIEKMLKSYPKKHSKSILFMHGDINGSKLSGAKIVENRISRKYLTNNFDIIINGHIHNHEVIYNKENKQVVNIGSLTSHSFADSNEHLPAYYILDTEDMSIQQIKNYNSPVFRAYNIFSEEDIDNVIDELKDCKYKVILKIKCLNDLKDIIENKLIKINEKYKNIIKFKFVLIYNKDNVSISVNNTTNNNKSIEDEFIEFLSQGITLKGNLNDYIKNIENDS